MSYQLTIIQGNLVRDPEMKDLGSTKLTKFTVASSRRYKDKSGDFKEEALFMDVAVWGAQAESCAKHLQKGAPVLVQGFLKNEEWNDKQTGAVRNKFVLQADKVNFMGTKKHDEQAPMPFGKAEAHMKMADPLTGQGELDLTNIPLPF